MIRFLVEMLIALAFVAWCVLRVVAMWAVFVGRHLLHDAGELAAALAVPPLNLLVEILRGVNWLFGLKG